MASRNIEILNFKAENVLTYEDAKDMEKTLDNKALRIEEDFAFRASSPKDS